MSNKKPKADKATKAPKDNYLKKPLIIMGGSLALLIITTVTISLLVFNNVINIPFIDDIFINTGMKEELYVEQPTETGENGKKPVEPTTNAPSNYTPPTFDSDEYFNNKAESYTEHDVVSSSKLMSEKEAYMLLSERGFTIYPVLTNTDVYEGYCDEHEINPYASDVHPTYFTQYRTLNDDVWLISIVENSIFATPLSYNNLNSTNLIFSETDTLTSYVATDNKFFINSPHSSAATLQTIEIINAESLEAVTF